MLRTGAGGAAENMRTDSALFERALRKESSRPVLRLYGWDGPALSVGAHQRLSEEVVERCAGLRIEVVRRPTGGTAVLHGTDLTYSVVAPHGKMSVLEAYREVAAGLVAGLALLGIDARVGTRHDYPSATRPVVPLGSRSACFATTLGADLQVGQKKVCGSAQVRRRGWLLQHGSILLRDNRALTSRILRHPGLNNSTCIEQLRPGTSEEDLAACLVRGFESRWGTASEMALETLLFRREGPG